MIETVSTLEIRQRLGDLLNRVALRHDEFIIERKGKPLAAMVPVERLEQMQQAARVHLLSNLARKSEGISQSPADQLADEAKHRTRRPRRK
ncbi:MAG: type II toxin-antitoxin system Phd/YefM family antitoxin [Nitrospira sp.]|nr:type II toxin-antitoxin system Phd/YefM family antitoxin [Nitrospira sp.]